MEESILTYFNSKEDALCAADELQEKGYKFWMDVVRNDLPDMRNSAPDLMIGILPDFSRCLFGPGEEDNFQDKGEKGGIYLLTIIDEEANLAEAKSILTNFGGNIYHTKH